MDNEHLNDTRTDDLRVRDVIPIIAPADLLQVFPVSDTGRTFVREARAAINGILKGNDRRLMVVVGPCSIHDNTAALDYAGRLSKLAAELSDQLFIVMRVYFEKPRTTIGWKGLINDPDMDGTHNISKGLGIARNLLCTMTEMRLPVATEMLDPITPQYLADLISWGAIGARTTESQTHREMVSGLSFPIGFKNGTDGNLQIAIDAMKSASSPHSFLGINKKGRSSIIRTKGNTDVHIVLRGGSKKPNYSPEDIAQTEDMLTKSGVPVTIMVDCSHGNSEKNHEKQPAVLESVVNQIAAGNRSISGVMIESFLDAGNQPHPKTAAELKKLKYGVSITDKCIDWETTENALRKAHAALKACGGRRLA